MNCVIVEFSLINSLESFAHHQATCLGFGYRVHILNLNQSLHIVLEHFLEEVLELISSEKFEDVLPLRRFLVIAQIWLHVTREDSQSGRFADTVRADESKHFT